MRVGALITKTQANRLGKGFFDEHINERIVAALKRGKAARRKPTSVTPVIASSRPMVVDRDQKNFRVKDINTLVLP